MSELTELPDSLKELDAKLRAREIPAAVTWRRDVDPVYVESTSNDDGLLAWGMAVDPATWDTQRTEALNLKWNMDVEEMFYVGDIGMTGHAGLLNQPAWNERAKFAYPDNILMEPMAFRYACVAGTQGAAKPVKWLQVVKKTEFRYQRSRLQFKLAWPGLLFMPQSGWVAAGGIAPLKFLTEPVPA
jgi:hypothetical protein